LRGLITTPVSSSSHTFSECSTLFPYTTLFRSCRDRHGRVGALVQHVPASRSARWGDSRRVPSRQFQCAATGCLARAPADEFQVENSPSNPGLDSVEPYLRGVQLCCV